MLVWILLVQNKDYKYTILYQYQVVPDIELKNTLYESRDNIFGEVSGFVRFDNPEDQPRNLRQYYVIKPLNKFDENSLQYFSINEIVKMQYLSPKSLGISELVEINENTRIITLSDENKNQFFIDKITKEVSMKDAGGNSVILITRDSDYKNFIKEWLLKK